MLIKYKIKLDALTRSSFNDIFVFCFKNIFYILKALLYIKHKNKRVTFYEITFFKLNIFLNTEL